MHQQYQGLYALLILSVITFSGCSSNDDPEAASNDSTSPQPPARVVAVEDDDNGDGTVDVRYEINYDADNRVTSTTVSNYESSPADKIYSYTYDGDDLVMQITPERTIQFTVENGRTVQVLSGNSSISYTYDSAGLLVSYAGTQDSDPDSACDESVTPVSDTNVLTLQGTIEYNAAGQVIRVVVNDEPALLATYLPDGKNTSFSISDNCGITFNYEGTYNDSGLLDRLSLSIDRSTEGTPVGLIGEIISSDTQYFYENSRLQRTSKISVYKSTNGTESTTYSLVTEETFSYTTDGLLSRIETSSQNEGGDFTLVKVRAILYEGKSCVQQMSSNPLSQIFGRVITNPMPNSEAALRCGYLSDVLD